MVLSERDNYKGKETEVDVITKSLAIIFYRLENRARCDDCSKFCMKSRSSENHCTQPCETWTGGIRYTQNYINLNGQRIDSLKLRKEIIASHEGIRNVEIFKSRSIVNENHQEKLTALILHSDKFDRIWKRLSTLTISRTFSMDAGVVYGTEWKRTKIAFAPRFMLR